MCNCKTLQQTINDTFRFNDSDNLVELQVDTNLARSSLTYRLRNNHRYTFGGRINKIFALTGDVDELLLLTKDNQRILSL